MEAMEIIFLVLGAVVFIISFLLPAGKKEETENAAKISEETIREMVYKEVDDAKSKISNIVDETVSYSMEKTERSMERITNEKMMAVSEYSDTVLAEINKNHQEVVFLYDMLNDKHESLKAVVSEASKTASEVKQTMMDVEITAKEVEIKAKEAQQAAGEAERRIQEAQQAVSEVEQKTKEAQQTVSEVELKAKEAQQAVNEVELKTKEVQRTADEAEKKVREAEFKPIVVQRVEAPKAPISSDGEPEKPKGTGKTTRKPRAPKAAKKEEKIEKPQSLPAQEQEAVPAAVEVPEVAVSLNEEGKSGGRNNNERILELHKAGKSNMAIARELGLGIGEVKLVIDLFEGM